MLSGLFLILIDAHYAAHYDSPEEAHMPTLGAPELIIILVLVVIVFGVGKLPEIGSAVGKGIREFRTASSDEPSDKPGEPPKPSSAA